MAGRRKLPPKGVASRTRPPFYAQLSVAPSPAQTTRSQPRRKRTLPDALHGVASAVLDAHASAKRRSAAELAELPKAERDQTETWLDSGIALVKEWGPTLLEEIPALLALL
jgi:hypothetical protein